MGKVRIPQDEMKLLIELVYGKKAGDIKDFDKFLQSQADSKGMFGFTHDFLERFMELLMSPDYTDSEKQIIKQIVKKLQ